jgi:anti-sigma B factor antagonist
METGLMGSDIVVKCRKCGHKLRTGSEFVGKKGVCPSCGAIIRVQRDGDTRANGTEEQVVAVGELDMGPEALLKVHKQNEVAVVTFATSRILDQSNVQQLGEELDSLVEDYGLQNIVLNFENVNYMSSAVMGKLVSLRKKVDGAGGQLVLCSIEESIYEIFKIMRFDKMFDIYETEDDAVIALMD